MPYFCLMAALISFGEGGAFVPLFTISTVSPAGTFDAFRLHVTFHKRGVAIVLSSAACSPQKPDLRFNMKKAQAAMLSPELEVLGKPYARI